MSVSYYAWFVQAVEVFAVWCVIAFVINLIFFRDKLFGVCLKIKRVVGNKFRKQ